MGEIVRRVWIVLVVLWSIFWVFLYVTGTHGMTAAELGTQRANTAFLLFLPWVAGWLLQWIVSGRRG